MNRLPEILPGFEALYGNGELKRYFSGEIERGTLSHAYLLEGKKGSGRHTLAFSAAYAMARFAEVPPAFSARIAARQSPDVRVFGVPEKKKTVGVDTVRLLKSETMLRPSELPFRVFLVEDADLMTPAAQNAALKLLEEPPAGVHFFLLAESAEALLETVRSRVTALRMERFSEEGLRDYLASGHCSLPEDLPGDPERRRRAAALADGCIGRLLTLLADESPKKSRGKDEAGETSAYRSERQRQAAELLAAVGKKDVRVILPAVLALPGTAGSGREELSALLTEAEKMLRDILLLRTGVTSSFSFFLTREDALAAGRPFTMAELLRLQETLREGKKRLSVGEGLPLFKSTLADALRRATRT